MSRDLPLCPLPLHDYRPYKVSSLSLIGKHRSYEKVGQGFRLRSETQNEYSGFLLPVSGKLAFPLSERD